MQSRGVEPASAVPELRARIEDLSEDEGGTHIMPPLPVDAA
jgi:hypothetical protein